MARRRTTRGVAPPNGSTATIPATTFTYFTTRPVADPPPLPPTPTLNVTTDDPKVSMANADIDPLAVAANSPPPNATAAFLRDLFAPRNFWASPTTWTGCTSPYHKFLLAALAIKASTSTDNAGLTTLGTALGATDVTRVQELSPQAPDGLKISMPGYTMFVIHGATRNEQLTYLRDRNAEKIWYANGTGFSETPMTTPSGGTASHMRDFTQIGAIYEPFVSSAQVWLNEIRTWWAASGGQKLVLVGHSLGAAIVELISAYMSVWSHNIRGMCETRYTVVGSDFQPHSVPVYLGLLDALVAGWGSGRGYPAVDHGVVFGQPNTMFEERYLLEASRNPQALAGMSRMPSSICRLDHPMDPVTRLPTEASFLENFWRWFPHRREPTKFTSSFPLRRQHLQAGWIGANAKQLELPSNLAIFLERVETYHGIQAYVNQVRDGLIDSYGPPSGDWSTLISSISALTGTNTTNWA